MTYSEYYELVLLAFKKLRKEVDEAEEFTINSYNNAIQAETRPSVQEQAQAQAKAAAQYVAPETEVVAEKPVTKSKGTK